mmetsp:Transcript_15135/g.34457  ORF Transcript_15135/g.34457 Transcript_15135/m.34457 type:complete len:440 (+) Transcript_15135:61-1380(+)
MRLSLALAVCCFARGHALGVDERHRRQIHIDKELLEESERRVDDLLMSPEGLELTSPHSSNDALSTLKLTDTESRLHADAASVAELADAEVESGDDTPKNLESATPAQSKEEGQLQEEADKLRDEGQGLERAHLESVSRGVDGTNLMRQMVRSKESMKHLESKIDALKEDAVQLRKKHDALALKLNSAMQPQLQKASDRVASQEARLQKARSRLDRWEKRLGEYKQQALDQVAKKKRTKESLKDIDKEIEKMERERDALNKEYEEIKNKTRNAVGAFRTVDTHYEAMKGKEELLERKLGQQEASLDRLQNVYKTETSQLDKSLEAGESRLFKKLQGMKVKLDQENQTMSGMRQEYLEWKTEQKQRDELVAKRRESFENSWREHAARRYDLARRSQEEAARKARQDSQWADDDWANEDGLDGTDVDDPVPESAGDQTAVP